MRLGYVFALAFLLVPAWLFGQDRSFVHKIDEKVPLKTSGGIWFWGDVLFVHQWHIQQNVKTDTYRLLDGKSVLRSYGSFVDCRTRLNEILEEEAMPPMAGTAVILLHGFGSNSMVTKPLAEWLIQKKAYDHVLNMTYPSTMQSILDHARMLERVIAELPQTVHRIDLIGHSLGSIIMRRYLSGPLDPEWSVPEDRLAARRQFSPDPRIGRLVMLGPPNNGAEVAKRLIGNDPIRRYFSGPSGDELGIHWEQTQQSLGIPCCPFIIIAGGRGDDKGFSLLIPGDDDGTVSTEGTKLPGAEAWIQFYVGHSEILLTEKIFETILCFMHSEAKLSTPTVGNPY